jgi:hypothetical protein
VLDVEATATTVATTTAPTTMVETPIAPIAPPVDAPAPAPATGAVWANNADDAMSKVEAKITLEKPFFMKIPLKKIRSLHTRSI